MGSALSWADWLTLSRMAAAPLLIAAALMGAPRVYAVLAAYGLLSDAIDGTVARVMNRLSERGARLDSRADLTFYSAFTVGLMLLVPRQMLDEWKTCLILVLAYLLPILLGWSKFRVLTSYHTVLARASLVLLMPAVAAWLWLHVLWPLRAAAVVLVLSALEEILITWILDAPRDNVSHVFRVLNGGPSRAIRSTASPSHPHALNRPWTPDL